MTDDVAEAERAWRASGALDDEARWLEARVRRGDLPVGTLAFLARLGHPAAGRVATDAAAPPPTTDLAAHALWGRRERDDGAAFLRARLAELEWILARALERGAELTPGDDAVLREARRRLDVVGAWLARPGPDRGELERAAQDLGGQLEVPCGRAAAAVADGARRLLATCCVNHVDEQGRFVGVGRAQWGELGHWVMLAAERYVSGAGDPEVNPRVAAAFGCSEDTVAGWPDALRAALRAAVAPWALGLGDPLAPDALRIELAAPCPAAWQDMVPVDERARRCETCQLLVHDVASLDRAEVLELLARGARGERACVRIYRREDGTVLTRDCPVGVRERLLASGGPRRPMPLTGAPLPR